VSFAPVRRARFAAGVFIQLSRAARAPDSSPGARPIRLSELMTAPIPPPISAFDFDFLATLTLAEGFGFVGPDAFIVAFALRSSGLDAGQAQRLFRDAEGRIQ
jgi:hypothetical protein